MGNKKPVPRKGRVVLAQVVKSVNTGGCHPPVFVVTATSLTGSSPVLGTTGTSGNYRNRGLICQCLFACVGIDGVRLLRHAGLDPASSGMTGRDSDTLALVAGGDQSAP